MAFSGPKLWDNTISLPFELDPFGVSDIQDVLVENDIKVHTIFGLIISTRGALRLPTAYDNQSHPIPSRPVHPHIALKTTSPLKIFSNKSNQHTNDYQ